jgi:hypothetical protein
MLGIAFATSACTPDEIALFNRVTSGHQNVLSEAQLERLRACESTGDYGVVSSNGKWFGAYQFTVQTWNGVAERNYPWLVGVKPNEADWWWQDAMAKALWAERGSQPWPVCGKRI